MVAIRFREGLPKSARATATEKAGAGPFATRYEVPGEKLTIVPIAPAIEEHFNATITSLNAEPGVSQAQPVFALSGNRIVAADRLIVGLDDKKDIARLSEKFSILLLEERSKSALFRIPENSNVFTLCDAIGQEPKIRFAEPDFVTIGRHIAKRSKTGQPVPFSPTPQTDQYAMKITRASDAWALQSGSPNIKIAILDEGVDTRHRDLSSVIAGTFDGVDADLYQEPNSWDGHGTACAGLAAAVGHGIRGSGTGCSVLAVRIAYSEYDGGPWITSNSIISRSIEWAWKAGADVLSNSWGGGAPSNEIAETFADAAIRGRGGRGCVVIIAAGNAATAVQFPGNLPNFITVSASNEYDQAKTRDSLDGENWWGTCYGPEIVIAAPGVHNLTTDITGSSGYDGGDYTPSFNGTSSSTPIVAGACGLILSKNSELGAGDVKRILCDSADKVGALDYDESGRNDYFGFGRLNVLRALELVESPPLVG